MDLALVGNTFDEPDCCFIPFCKDKLVIATPVNEHYLQYQQKWIPMSLISQIFSENHLLCAKPVPEPRKKLTVIWKNEIFQLLPRIVARMNDLEAIRKSVAGGLGIFHSSACSAKDLADTHQILMFPLNHESIPEPFTLSIVRNGF